MNKLIVVAFFCATVALTAGQMGGEGCSENLEKLFGTEMMNFDSAEKLFENVCGAKDVPILMKHERGTPLSRALCRCDKNAQFYLKPEDRVAQDVRCNCNASGRLTEQQMEEKQERQMNELYEKMRAEAERLNGK